MHLKITPFVDENYKLRFCTGGHEDPCGPKGLCGADTSKAPTGPTGPTGGPGIRGIPGPVKTPGYIFSGPVDKRGFPECWVLLFNPDDHIKEIRENKPLMRLLSRLDKDDRRRLLASVAQLRQIKAELSYIAGTLVERECAAKSEAAPDVYTFDPACVGLECVAEHIEALLAAYVPDDRPFPEISPKLLKEVAELVRKNIEEQLSPMPPSRTGGRCLDRGGIVGEI